MKERLGPDLAAKGLSTSGKDFHTPPTIFPFPHFLFHRLGVDFRFFNFSIFQHQTGAGSTYDKRKMNVA